MEIPELDSFKLGRLPLEIAISYFKDYPEGEWIGLFSYWIQGVPVNYSSWRYFKNRFPLLAREYDFETYKEGFISGFSDFTESPFLNNEERKKEIFLESTIWHGIAYTFDEGHKPKITQELAYMSGKKAGKLYFCWYQIVEHSEAFRELFSKLNKTILSKENGVKKRKRELLGLFCQLINKTKIEPMTELETEGAYCERICNKYGFAYTDRVRQHFKTEEFKKFKVEILRLSREVLSQEELYKVKETVDKELETMN